jgi:O-methyltransferase
MPPDRAPRAVAATADPEGLRAAYLDLLKLCLCDLGGTGTTSVWTHTDGSLLSRNLAGDELAIRVDGVDWPLHGTTMVGLRRLDDLQTCVESVVRDGVEGDVIEAGTWRGGASILMRATLDALGADDRTVWVADSFQGFPAADEDLAPIDYLAVPVEAVRANFARFGYERGVRFVEGFFEDTLPGLAGEQWSIVRLDGDTYEATWMTLQALYPRLSAGGYLIVDDYGAVAECRRAVDEFRARHGIDDPLEPIDWTCMRWRRSSDAPLEPAGPAHPAPAAASRAVAREQTAERVVSIHERGLMREKHNVEAHLAAVQAQLAAAQREVAELRGSPFRGPRAWLRSRLRRVRSHLDSSAASR